MTEQRCGDRCPENESLLCDYPADHPSSHHFNMATGEEWPNASYIEPMTKATGHRRLREMGHRMSEHLATEADAANPGVPRPLQDHDGVTFVKHLDKDRLNTQLLAVHELMEDGKWRTLPEIVATLKGNEIRATEASVSARLRDLRKPKFGSMTVERRRKMGSSGLWEYRLVS